MVKQILVLKILFIIIFCHQALAQTIIRDSLFRTEVDQRVINPGSQLFEQFENIVIKQGETFVRFTEKDPVTGALIGNTPALIVEFQGSSEKGYTVYYRSAHFIDEQVNSNENGTKTYTLKPNDNKSAQPKTNSSSKGTNDGEDLSYSPGSGMGDSLGSALVSSGLSAVSAAYQKDIQKIYDEIGDLQKKTTLEYESIKNMRVSINDSLVSLSVEFNEGMKSFGSLPDIKLENIENINFFKSKEQSDLRKHSWLSEDLNFISEAESIRAQLLQPKLDTELKKEFFKLGEEFLLEADRWSSINAKQESETHLKLAATVADALTGWDPYTGLALSIYEFTTGKNVFTGEKISEIERLFAGVGLISFGYGRYAQKLPGLFKLIQPVAEKVQLNTYASYVYINHLIETAGHGISQTVRSINFTPTSELAKWAFSNRYVEKSLSVIEQGSASAHSSAKQFVERVIEVSQSAPTRAWVENGKNFIEVSGQVVFDENLNDKYSLTLKLTEVDDYTWDIIDLLIEANQAVDQN